MMINGVLRHGRHYNHLLHDSLALSVEYITLKWVSNLELVTATPISTTIEIINFHSIKHTLIAFGMWRYNNWLCIIMSNTWHQIVYCCFVSCTVHTVFRYNAAYLKNYAILAAQPTVLDDAVMVR